LLMPLLAEETVGSVHGGPGLPLMKLGRDTANCTLELTEELPNLRTPRSGGTWSYDERPGSSVSSRRAADR
jgi:hypothetical protein